MRKVLSINILTKYDLNSYYIDLCLEIKTICIFVACPGAVAVEAGCGGTLAPLGPPQTTAGTTFIRLVISRPIVCNTVQVRLYKPRDSSNMGLLQLKLLAMPAFNTTIPISANT